MHNLKRGNIIKIRNSAGILEVKLLKKMNMGGITRNIHEQLWSFKNLRLEFHERKSEKIITLYDQRKDNETIFIIFNLDNYADVEIWEGTFPKSGEYEDTIFTTMEYRYDDLEDEMIEW